MWRRVHVPGERERLRAYHSKFTAHRYRTDPYVRFKVFGHRLKAMYGITREVYDAMVIAQSGLCAVCDRQLVVANVDHCHKTGAVRGLLCLKCNHLVGHLEQPQVERARAYLQTWLDAEKAA